MNRLFLGYKILNKQKDEESYISPIVTTTWVVGEANKAFCVFDKEHLAPEPSCTCGIYLVKQKKNLPMFGPPYYLGSNISYLATCVAWGTIIEGTEGFRCEYVRAESIVPIAGVCCECDKEFEEGYVVFYPLQIQRVPCGLCSGHFKESEPRESRVIFLKIPEPEVLQVQSFWRK